MVHDLGIIQYIRKLFNVLLMFPYIFDGTEKNID